VSGCKKLRSNKFIFIYINVAYRTCIYVSKLWHVSMKICACLAVIIYFSLAYILRLIKCSPGQHFRNTNLSRMWFLLLLQITLAGQEHEEEEDKKTNQLVFFVYLPFLCCPEKQHKVALFHDLDIKIWGYQFFFGSVWSYWKKGRLASLLLRKGWGLWFVILSVTFVVL